MVGEVLVVAAALSAINVAVTKAPITEPVRALGDGWWFTKKVLRCSYCMAHYLSLGVTPWLGAYTVLGPTWLDFLLLWWGVAGFTILITGLIISIWEIP